MLSVYLSENRTSIKFLAIGDWGGVPYPPYITAVQKATAREMSKVAEQMGADFILALGDNFYYKGVNSVDSPRFKVSYVTISDPRRTCKNGLLSCILKIGSKFFKAFTLTCFDC